MSFLLSYGYKEENIVPSKSGTEIMIIMMMEENMAEDRHIWRLGMDRLLLAVYILKIK